MSKMAEQMVMVMLMDLVEHELLSVEEAELARAEILKNSKLPTDDEQAA